MSDRAVLLTEVVLIAAWLGAAVFFSAVVAQAAFAVLPTRTLAGALVGRVLPVLFNTGMVLGALVWAMEAAWGRGWMSSRAIAAIVALASCAVAQFVVGGRIEQVRAAIGGPIDALAVDDARRVAFGRLHAFSVGWLGVGIIASLVALVLAMRALTPRR